MSTSYARAGQRIAGRFDLVFPYAYQPGFGNATAWIARDVALSRQVRAVILDPDDERVALVADAARRAALVADPHLVAIVQVVADEDHAYITEIPPGRPIADYLTGEPLPADQVHAIIGEATNAITTGARRGVRHLHTRAETIFVTQEGDVVVDGLGVYAALADADTTKPVSELDRDEARGLTVLLASLLLGRNLPDPSEHDAVIAEAANLDLPDQLASTLASERDGDGAASPSDLTRRLVPWGDIDVAALPEAREPRPIAVPDTMTVEEAAPTSNDTLIFDDEDADSAQADSTQAMDEPVPEDDVAEDDAENDLGETQAAPLAIAVAGAAGTAAATPPATPPVIPPAAEEGEPEDIREADARPRASSHDEVTALIDEELGLEGNEASRIDVSWPGLRTVPAPQPLPPASPEAEQAEADDVVDHAFTGAGPSTDATDETVEMTPLELSEESADGTVPPERLTLAQRFEDAAPAAAATAAALAGGPAPGTPAPPAQVPLDEDGNPIRPKTLGDRLEDAAGAASATAAALAGGPAPGTPAPPAQVPLDEDGNPIERPSLATRFADASPAASATAAALAGGPAPGTPAPRAKSRVPKISPERAAASEQARREKEDARSAALESYSEERGKTFNASRVVLALFAIAVLVVGWIGFRTLTAPFDPVTLTDPDSDVATATAEDPTEDPAAAEPTEDPAPAPTADPVIATASLVSPDAGMIQGIDPAQQDNPQSVVNAVDGNPATAWQSWTYVSPTMSPMSGIGLHVELEEEAVITDVVLNVSGNGGNIQIRDTVPDAPSSGKVMAEGPVTEGETTLTLSEPLTASSFIIWITELPQNASAENQIILNEITLN